MTPKPASVAQLTQIMTWLAISIYVGITVFLTIRGALKTKSLESFAVGSRDIPPSLVGLSLTAQLTSVATFVINPGLIFHYGLSGLLGLGGAAALGIMLGLVFFSRRFRKMGSQVAAITLPQWIGARYESKPMQVGFGVVSLALVTYAVLIVVGLTLVLQKMLGLSHTTVAIALVVFVLSYVIIGGANTHAYTNAIQAVIMLAVALLLIFNGLPLLWKDGGLFAKLAAIDPNLATITNPKSLYFRNLFEVFFCNFLVGLAIVCQPHIVSKALYLKDDSQVKRYLTVAIIAGTVFLFVMIVGLYARTILPANTRADLVVPIYIIKTFSPGLQVLISIGLLCAGLSTLEGILLALSAIFSTDLYLPFASKPEQSDDTKAELRKKALLYGRLFLVAVGAVTVLLALRQIANPTGGSVAIFAQYGVYLLFTASFFPLACGMFLPKVRGIHVAIGAIVSILTYLGVATFKLTFMSNNPAFLATCGIICGWLTIGLAVLVSASSAVATPAPKEAS